MREKKRQSRSMKSEISMEGFSLIEAMIAMLILTVGILGLYTMQINSIKGNSKANTITEASTWVSDQLEYLMALDYLHPDLTAGDHGPVNHGAYSITWSVTDDSPQVDNKTISVSVMNNIYPHSNTFNIVGIKGKIN